MLSTIMLSLKAAGDADGGDPDHKRRPPNTAFPQQRIEAWHPYLDPWWVVVTLFIIGAVCVPVGFKLQSMSDEIVEIEVPYDAFDDASLPCFIGNVANANETCLINITVPKDMASPVLVYYKLENFYQNHRNYARSRDIYQLAGQSEESQGSRERDLCDPLNIVGGIRLNPCGLQANTLFNDVISLTNDEFLMREDGIAWQSDIEYVFKQPDGFRSAQCPDNVCDSTCCEGDEWSCTEPYEDEDGVCWSFFYPNEDTTQYLYETYPMVVNPLEGVTNEHFVVWMRTATTSTFRKLYGYVEETIPAGTGLTFEINANFEVASFDGRKSLILTTNNRFGGNNVWIGPLFYASGFFCLGVGAFFALKQLVRPRKVGDEAYLHYKED